MFDGSFFSSSLMSDDDSREDRSDSDDSEDEGDERYKEEVVEYKSKVPAKAAPAKQASSSSSFEDVPYEEGPWVYMDDWPDFDAQETPEAQKPRRLTLAERKAARGELLKSHTHLHLHLHPCHDLN